MEIDKVNNIKFSVIIPLYNKYYYINRAIDSVLNQTYENYELIVVNDGSIDGSEKLVEKYNDNRIRLINQNNQGECAARNMGIKNSNFDYLAFLDADDKWLPKHLSIIHNLIQKYPECGAFATAYKTIQEDGKEKIIKFKGLPKKSWSGIIPNFFKTMQGYYPVNSSTIIVKKEVFKNVGEFPIGIKRGGDGDMWIRIALSYKIAFDNKISAIYYENAINRMCNEYPPPINQNIADITLKEALLKNNYEKHILKKDIESLLNWRTIIRYRDNYINNYENNLLKIFKEINIDIQTIYIILKEIILKILIFKLRYYFKYIDNKILKYNKCE